MTYVSIQVASCLLPISSEIYNCIEKQIKLPLLLYSSIVLLNAEFTKEHRA